MTLRIGTRASLLAIAQSRLVAADLQRQHPSLRIELVTIATRGDRDLSTPLRQVTDGNFFTAELDDALLNGEVDLCVHSYKDLPPTRPQGLVTAALPKREDPRDAVLFHSRSLEKLARGERLLIGSSSARRQQHIGDFLSWALPHSGTAPLVDFVDLRGAVDQRIEQLFEARDDGLTLDGAVLAVAGLNRLYNDRDGFVAIAQRLKQLHWMVPPLSACPTASGQGSLAIECRTDDAATAALLLPLDHQPTRAALVEEERLLSDDSKAEGTVTVVLHDELGLLGFIRGQDAKTSVVVDQPPKNRCQIPAFDGTQLAQYYVREVLPLPADLASASAIYVAHHRCATLHENVFPQGRRVWVAGTTTWRELAARGIWVEGCTDHLGFEAMSQNLACAVFQLPAIKDWVAITHTDAAASWRSSGVGRVIAAYRNRAQPLPAEVIDAVRDTRNFFWSSPDQFRRLRAFIRPDATHAAGPGKTAKFLREQGVNRVNVFPSRSVWRQWSV